MNMVIGSDHAGYDLKEFIKSSTKTIRTRYGTKTISNDNDLSL